MNMYTLIFRLGYYIIVYKIIFEFWVGLIPVSNSVNTYDIMCSTIYVEYVKCVILCGILKYLNFQ